MLNNKINSGKVMVDRDTKSYVYILVREDLTIAQQGVQVAHAGMLAISKHGGLKEDTRLVVLKVKNQQQLLDYFDMSKDNGLKAEKFFEPDYDIFWSAMSTAPISREEGKIFKKLPLWRP